MIDFNSLKVHFCKIYSWDNFRNSPPPLTLRNPGIGWASATIEENTSSKIAWVLLPSTTMLICNQCLAKLITLLKIKVIVLEKGYTNFYSINSSYKKKTHLCMQQIFQSLYFLAILNFKLVGIPYLSSANSWHTRPFFWCNNIYTKP